MKRIMIVLAVLIVAALSAGIVGAQEPETPPTEDGIEENARPTRIDKLELIAEISGIDIETLREGLAEEDATLASVIEANGGDVEAIQAAVVDAIVEQTGRDTEDVAEHIEEHFNSTRPQRGEGFDGGRPGEGRPGRGGRGEGRPPFSEELPSDTEAPADGSNT